MTKCNHFQGCNKEAVHQYDSLLLCEEHAIIAEKYLEEINEILDKVNAKHITDLGL